MLRASRCDDIQGFLFSPAVPPDEFADLARATADGVREPLNRRATIDINF